MDIKIGRKICYSVAELMISGWGVISEEYVCEDAVLRE
jgi:hypothetical protein